MDTTLTMIIWAIWLSGYFMSAFLMERNKPHLDTIRQRNRLQMKIQAVALGSWLTVVCFIIVRMLSKED